MQTPLATRLRALLVALLLILAGSNLAPLRAADEVTLNFRHLTAGEGLPSNWVGALLQDRHGMMWIGTDRGLCRYDGSEFVRPAGSDVTTSVHALHEADAVIWAGLDNGLYYYDCRKDSLLPAPMSLPDGRRITSQVTWIGNDHHGNLWLSTMGQGIFRFNPGNSPSYFSKCFQKQFGIKPGDFAEQSRES